MKGVVPCITQYKESLGKAGGEFALEFLWQKNKPSLKMRLSYPDEVREQSCKFEHHMYGKVSAIIKTKEEK